MAETQQPTGVRLQVAGARPQDVGKSIARLNRNLFETPAIREGDVVEIICAR